MPVIRGEAKVSVITSEQRDQIISQLARELSGETTPGGPIIFEIPFEASGKFFDALLGASDSFDVLVVWDAWRSFGSEQRSTIIRDVYNDRPNINVVQALGVTVQEAIDEQLLPYAIVPMVRSGVVDLEELRQAMIAEGAITLAQGRIELRLPTMSLAEQALRRLAEKLPKGFWSIIQTTDSIPEIV